MPGKTVLTFSMVIARLQDGEDHLSLQVLNLYLAKLSNSHRK
jgi:hypothetical protein